MVRRLILENLPMGFQEVMQYGMISYVIPLPRYPKTYNKQPLAYVFLAAQKNYSSLYLMGVYGEGVGPPYYDMRGATHITPFWSMCRRFQSRPDSLQMDFQSVLPFSAGPTPTGQ